VEGREKAFVNELRNRGHEATGIGEGNAGGEAEDTPETDQDATANDNDPAEDPDFSEVGEDAAAEQPQPDPDSTLPVLVLRNGVPMADSREVAGKFGKEHKNVLRDIRDLECSADFRRLNFELFKIKDLSKKDGESTSHVEMTRDGLAFLVMGFTGAKAARWKERYIEAFNQMESQLRQKAAAEGSGFMSALSKFQYEAAEVIAGVQMDVYRHQAKVTLFAEQIRDLQNEVGLLRKSRNVPPMPRPRRSVTVSEYLRGLGVRLSRPDFLRFCAAVRARNSGVSHGKISRVVLNNAYDSLFGLFRAV
jgi:Rha family phage regulatory protein